MDQTEYDRSQSPLEGSAPEVESLPFDEDTMSLGLTGRVLGAEVDLSNVSARRVVIEVRGIAWNPDRPTQVLATDIRLSNTVRVVEIRLNAERQGAVRFLEPAEELHISVVGPRRGIVPRLILHATSVRTLTAIRARVDITTLASHSLSRRRTIDKLDLYTAQAEVVGRNISQIRINGACEVKCRDTPVGELLVTKGCSLLGHGNRPIRRLVTDSSTTAKASEPDLILRGGSSIEIDNVGWSFVVLKEGSCLKVASAEGLLIRGPGTIHMRGQGSDLRFAHPAPVLETDRHVALVGLRGGVRLGDVSGSSLSGVPLPKASQASEANAFVLVSVGENDASAEGASLIDVAVPSDLSGLSMLASLHAEALHVAPLVHSGLPGLGSIKGASADARSEKTQLEAEVARAISSLAANKGAPASVRTTLAWCRYRMRNVVAPQRSERSLLSLYRLIGYGERFVPPFVLFVVLASVINSLALWEWPITFNAGNIKTWLAGFIDWLITPLHLLRLTRPDKTLSVLSEPWDTLARLTLAIPFATAVLVLRKYVKEDDERRP